MNRLLRDYVCVRVESMAGIDFLTFHFDFDLTFALLLMTPDGAIRHTVGGRDFTSAESHLSLASLTQTLRKATVTHRAGVWALFKRPRPHSVEAFSAYKAKVAKKGVPQCVHCHELHDYERDDAVAPKRWHRHDEWRWPDPRQVGLVIGKDYQASVRDVLPDSPAARAGLRRGDEIERVGAQSVLTFGDVQRALHQANHRAVNLPLFYSRNGVPQKVSLSLRAGWKRPTPLVFSWRASKWRMSPKPGFGGKALTAAEKVGLGIPPEDFAFRVTYLVTWGPAADTGRRAVQAGLRKGDVVVSIDGKSDFADQGHVHAWFRMTRTPGKSVTIKTLRNGTSRTVRLSIPKSPSK